MHVAVIDDLAQLDPRTVEAWVGLAEPAGAVYLSPQWYLPWAEATGDRPLIVVVREGAELVGILPLLRRRSALRFAGDRAGDDFFPLVADGADRREVLAAMGRGLALERGWNRLIARQQRVGADWLEGLAAGLPRAHARVSRPVDPRPVITPPGGGYEGYMAGLRRSVRKETRRRRRRLEEPGDVVTTMVGDGDDLGAAIDELLALHDLRWSQRGGSDIRADDRVATRAFARAAAGRGWLRLWLMRVGGRPGAAEMAVRVGPRQVHFMAGFAPQLAPRGVGIVLMSHALEEAIESGAAEIDLGGGASTYKLDYATGTIAFEHVTLLPASSPRRHALAGWLAVRSAAVRAMPDGLNARLRDLKRRARGVRARRASP
jgi:CelD/BcsL family acetyltransferase involved in cellulose biosynthesis